MRLLGDIGSHPGAFDAEAAESHYRQALALGEELDMRPLVAHCHLGLGEAREHLTTATSMYREMEITFWWARAEAALADLT